MGMVNLTVTGLNQTLARMRQLPSKVARATKIVLVEEAEEIMNISKSQFVPVDQGTLRSSGHVQLPVQLGGIISVTAGYGGAAAPYALSVHENRRAGKTAGVSPSGQSYAHWAKVGQWKYLENPFKSRSRGMRRRIDVGIKQWLEVHA